MHKPGVLWFLQGTVINSEDNSMEVWGFIMFIVILYWIIFED